LTAPRDLVILQSYQSITSYQGRSTIISSNQRQSTNEGMAIDQGGNFF
jgi:hypothetical protein